MKKFLSRLQAVLEWPIALLFIYGAFNLIGLPPLEGEGFMVLVFGGQVALYLYMVWFTLLGVGLIFSKVRRKKKLHRHVLLAMYLTTVYTATLASAIYGISLANIADDVVIGVLCAWFWLRWKLHTEYVDPKHFIAVADGQIVPDSGRHKKQA